MPEFLDLIETLRAEDASMERIYGDEGSRITARTDAAWLKKLEVFTDLLAEARGGNRRALYKLQEAQSTSDFSNLFGDVLQRQLLGGYREIVPSYPNYTRISDAIPDFRTVKRLAVDGLEGVLSEVPQLTEYPEGSMSDSVFSYAVKKYGRRFALSWETLVNDDLGAFSSSPERLARAARRSEEKFVTQLFVDANGPHASFYTSGNKNIINTSNGAASNNPALSIAAFQDAMTVLSRLKDTDGEPIFVEAVELVVPPALEVVAQNILNATQLLLGGAGQVGGGGVAAQQLQVNNWMRNRTRLSVNPYIPTVAATANGNTSWFLFASIGSGRPALEIGFLRGNREPALFRKAPNAERVGGGGADSGDFDIDAFAWKVRHVMGGTRLDPKATIASNGSGS